MSDGMLPDNLLLRHRLVRAAFVAKGSSLKAWCEQEGVKRQNADKALMDQWKGPKASAIVTRILEATGVAA